MQETIFVGRERQKEVYKQFLARETPWVMIITGLGGIGKSTLLHRLGEYTRTEPALSKTGVVTVDFANEELRNDPLKLLDVLTEVTALYCNVQQMNDDFKKVLQQSFDQLAQLRQERLATGVSEFDDLTLREIRHQMRELATEAFYAQIKTLALDRLVIMLDTCEWLTEPEGIEIGQWVLNELVPGVHNRIKQQGKQCPVIMVSRVQLKLDAINGRDQRSISLPMLEKADVDEYLQHMGMQDPNLLDRVYKVTHGHALCVSIIGDYWRNREDHNQPFTIEDLPELQLQEFSEIALMRFTNERVLKQLKSPFKELTRFGVLIRSFDLPFLRTVFSEFLPEPEALARFNQLIRYPYIEFRGNYRYAFHELLREALAEDVHKEEPEAWKCYHKRAFDYLSAAAQRSPDWYYHLLAYDEKRGLVEWQQAIQEARSSGKREYIGALLQAALDKALHLSPITHAEVVYEQGRFNYYGVQWEEALKSYNEALVTFERTEDYIGQAKTLQAIGDVQRTLGKPDAALESYRRSRLFFQQAGDKLGEARCCQAMGDIRRLRNELDSALLCYEQCLVLFRNVEEKPEEAKALEAVGDIQRLRNDLDAAQRSYEQALSLYQEEKDRLKRAKLLKSMGDVQRLHQNQDAAMESYRQALAIFGELKEPIEEANVWQAIVQMQRPQSEIKSPQQSYGPTGSSLVLPVSGLQTSTPQIQRHPGIKRRSPIWITSLLLVIVVSSVVFFYEVVLIPHRNAPHVVPGTAIATASTATLSYPPPGAIQVLTDPLSLNSHNWQVNSNSDGSCNFTGASYHVIKLPGSNSGTQPVSNPGIKSLTTPEVQPTVNTLKSSTSSNFHICTSSETNFSNIVYEIEMEIKSGDDGGIILRSNSTHTNFYYMRFSQSGLYSFEIIQGNRMIVSKPIFTKYFHQGDQTNLIAILAQGNFFSLFVNNTFITTISDNTYTSGQIGVVAESTLNLTEVVFTNVRVWKLT